MIEPIVTERKETPEAELKRHLTMWSHLNEAHETATQMLKDAREREERVRTEVRQLHDLVMEAFERVFPEAKEDTRHVKIGNVVYQINSYNQTIHPIEILIL